jgi:hypothetical protein
LPNNMIRGFAQHFTSFKSAIGASDHKLTTPVI